MGVILLFIVPAITMRLFAEERRDRTDVLLFSAPIDSWAIILGKFFAALGFVGVLLVGTLPYPIILLATSNLDPGILFSSYCGLILLVASFIAVGLFFSAMTENQVIAFVLTMGSLLFMWVLAGASYSVGPILGEIIRYASIFTHFSNFGAGVLDTSDILYYLSLIGLGLFATNLAFDANQWS
jgi:ABC-2 type transport system permease protein